MVKSHKNLEVWGRSVDFVTNIYKATAGYPKHEIYGLASQIRRAAVSIASNISEGAARQSHKEFIQFLYIALGSASEVDVQLLVSRNLEYISDDQYLEMSREREEISKMLFGLIRNVKSRL